MARDILRHEEQHPDLKEFTSGVALLRRFRKRQVIRGTVQGALVATPLSVLSMFMLPAKFGATATAFWAARTGKFHPRMKRLETGELFVLEGMQNLIEHNPHMVKDIQESTPLVRVKAEEVPGGEGIPKGHLVAASNPYWEPERLIVVNEALLSPWQKARLKRVREGRRRKIDKAVRGELAEMKRRENEKTLGETAVGRWLLKWAAPENIPPLVSPKE